MGSSRPCGWGTARLVDRTLLEIDGRLGRRSFVIIVVTLAVAGSLIATIPQIGDIACIPVAWPLLCAAAKRLHDVGRSARIAIGVAALCLSTSVAAILVGLLAGGPSVSIAVVTISELVVLAGLVSCIAASTLIIWLGIAAGDRGSNAFGLPERPRWRIARVSIRDTRQLSADFDQ